MGTLVLAGIRRFGQRRRLDAALQHSLAALRYSPMALLHCNVALMHGSKAAVLSRSAPVHGTVLARHGPGQWCTAPWRHTAAQRRHTARWPWRGRTAHIPCWPSSASAPSVALGRSLMAMMRGLVALVRSPVAGAQALQVHGHTVLSYNLRKASADEATGLAIEGGGGR